MITVRTATPNDAASQIALRKQLFRETSFLLLQPDEYNPSLESETDFITSFDRSKNSQIFVAVENESALIGFMGVAGGATRRTAHKATVFLGILRTYWGKGIAKELFNKLFEWQKATDITRLELTTAVNNERAYSLYQGIGFKTECIKKQNIFVDGEPVDEYQMVMLLPRL